MKKNKISVILFFFLCSSCNAQKTTITLPKINNGEWICVQDTLNKIVVDGSQIFEYYNGKGMEATTYIISSISCDTTYKSPKKEALFLTWHKTLCYEVTGLTNDYLELIYTSNGKTITYYRKK